MTLNSFNLAKKSARSEAASFDGINFVGPQVEMSWLNYCLSKNAAFLFNSDLSFVQWDAIHAVRFLFISCNATTKAPNENMENEKLKRTSSEASNGSASSRCPYHIAPVSPQLVQLGSSRCPIGVCLISHSCKWSLWSNQMKSDVWWRTWLPRATETERERAVTEKPKIKVALIRMIRRALGNIDLLLFRTFETTRSSLGKNPTNESPVCLV